MTSDQEKWFEKAEQRLSGARLMLANDLYDTAASFAYYTMFYVVTALMLEKGKKFKKHSALSSAFSQDWIQTGLVGPEFHRYLLNGFDMRNKADYDLGQSNDKEAAELQIVRAEAFIEMGREKLK